MGGREHADPAGTLQSLGGRRRGVGPSIPWRRARGPRSSLRRLLRSGFGASAGHDPVRPQGLAPLPGSPDAFYASVSHDDAASAVLAALAAPAGVYNVADDEPMRRREYFDSLARALGVAPPKFPPVWMALLAGSLGETLARSLRISNRKLREECGWVPKHPSAREGWPAVVAALG